MKLIIKMRGKKRKTSRKLSKDEDDDVVRLQYITRRILDSDPDSEINKFWEEIMRHGGYDALKEKVQSTDFTQLYTQEELLFVQENLEIYRKCSVASSIEEVNTINVNWMS